MKFFSKKKKGNKSDNNNKDELWQRMKDELNHNTMDLDELRDEVIRCIMKGDQVKLKTLCEDQIIVTAPVMVQKCIQEMKPGHRFNDMLFAMAQEMITATPMLGMYHSSLLTKRHLVSDPSLPAKQLITPFVSIELSPDEFMERITLILGTHVLMGIDELVQTNPNNVRQFIMQMTQQGKTIDRKSKFFMALSEMASTYRDCHHSDELVKHLEETIGPLNLLRDPDKMGFQIFQGADSMNKLDDEAKEIKQLLVAGEFDSAQEHYRTLIPKMKTIYSNMTPMGEVEYPSALLFQAMLLAIKKETKAAQELWAICTQNRYHYGELLMFNAEEFVRHKKLICSTFKNIPSDEAKRLSFDGFFERLTGHSYEKSHWVFDKFIRAAGDREMEVAFELTEQLIEMYQMRENNIVKQNFCQILAYSFQACHFALQNNYEEARKRHTLGLKGSLTQTEIDSEFERLKHDPEAVLAKFFGD